MNMSTIKTTIGFVFTLVDQWLPISLRRSSLSSIYNYIQINEHISTSGQATPKQFASIAKAGFNTIINLAPHSAENALPDEPKLIDALNLKYIHIPVDFKYPSDDDFNTFCGVMYELKGQKVWVHCAANMRVSAFIYRYRVTVLNHSPEIAKRDLAKIWEPFGRWRAFVAID